MEADAISFSERLSNLEEAESRMRRMEQDLMVKTEEAVSLGEKLAAAEAAQAQAEEERDAAERDRERLEVERRNVAEQRDELRRR